MVRQYRFRRLTPAISDSLCTDLDLAALNIKIHMTTTSRPFPLPTRCPYPVCTMRGRRPRQPPAPPPTRNPTPEPTSSPTYTPLLPAPLNTEREEEMCGDGKECGRLKDNSV
jgi:hypothetical protein